MANLNWYQPLERCTTLDEVRMQWHELLDRNHMSPSFEAPRYQDAMLSFLGACALPPALKLASVLALGSAFDVDFRLALGALGEQTMNDELPWPDSVRASVSDNGPALQVATADHWLGAFVAGRMAGLRETLNHDGTRIDAWQAAFWNSFLEMACRHAAHDGVRLALGKGADPRANDYAAVRAAGRGMHRDKLEFGEYGLPEPGDEAYGRILLQLVEGGLPAQDMLPIALRAAASVDNTSMLDLLAAQGANIRRDGGDALAAAAAHLAFGAFEWLLEHGADVNAGGGAVLNAAVASLDETMVETVLEAGADLGGCASQVFLTLLDTQPWDLYSAETDFSGWRAELIALLLRHGARPTGPDVIDAFKRNRDGKRILEAAAEHEAIGDDGRQLLEVLAGQAFGPVDRA
jgi:hypothetical protein